MENNYHQTEDSQEEEWWLKEQLGMCGCGRPEGAMKYILGAMLLLWDSQRKSDLLLTPSGGVTPEWEAHFEEYRKNVNEYFHSEGENDGIEYHMWYYLDDNGLTDHGGSVPGWLSEHGKEVMKRLCLFLVKEGVLDAKFSEKFAVKRYLEDNSGAQAKSDKT